MIRLRGRLRPTVECRMLSNERNGEDRTPIRAICSSVVESQLGVYSLLNLRRGRHRCNTRDVDAVFE